MKLPSSFATSNRSSAASTTVKLLASLSVFLSFSSISQACPVCFTAPDSLETKGMTLAILFLLGTIGTVVCGVASFFIYLVAKEKNPSPAHQELAYLAFHEESLTTR